MKQNKNIDIHTASGDGGTCCFEIAITIVSNSINCKIKPPTSYYQFFRLNESIKIKTLT